jgi:16S rRNA (adenine1518-N6/adenine1519-N6)-dimethyltransferase
MTDDARALLEQHGLHASKRLGQNFLRDPAVLEHIKARLERARPTGLVEIGPGLGALTAVLAELGLPMVAIERDRGLVPVVRARMTPYANVHIHEGDALETAFASLLPAVARPMVVGNLPYSISSPLLLAVLEQRASIGGCVFMLQREFADRLAADVDTSAYGSLTALFTLVADVNVAFDVAPGAFFPVPKVWSSVIEIKWLAAPRAEVPSVAAFEAVTRAAFGQRRKTLRNALSSRYARDVVDAALDTSALDGRRRAETLDVFELAKLTRALAAGGALGAAAPEAS